MDKIPRWLLIVQISAVLLGISMATAQFIDGQWDRGWIWLGLSAIWAVPYLWYFRWRQTDTRSKLIVKGEFDRAVVLDRIERGKTPSYYVHGQTTCMGCGDWCWLGDQTYQMVTANRYAPFCRQCAQQWPQDEMTFGRVVRDRRITDGPHVHGRVNGKDPTTHGRGATDS